MKAIVMAGGEGSRLRPLTCDLPKPMVPFFDKPIMEHQINLLRKYSFDKIGVTTAYLPEKISSYFGDGSNFGVYMQYFNEETPLGTAGSVKNALSFLDETFLVISGDAVTDINLYEAMRFHREKDSQLTIVLKRVDIPLNYGVVVTNENGRILRFLEKPDWGEVFSDAANTGIYIIEPELLQRVPEGCPYDFSRQLFPKLLGDGIRMYGYIAREYWCDIGDLSQYKQAHWDALDGRLKLDMGRQIAPGLFIRAGSIPAGCSVDTPVYIGKGADIENGVELGQYSVIGRDSELGYGASAKHSIIWQSAIVEPGAELRGAIVCDNTRLGKNSRLFEGSVLGSRSVTGSNVTIHPDVCVWPGKNIAKNSDICDNIVWGNGRASYAGEAMRDMNIRKAAAAGYALGSMAKGGKGIGLACSKYAAAAAMRLAANGGICAAGCKSVDMGFAALPAMRYQMKQQGLEAGLYVDYSEGLCEFRFFDEKEFGREKLHKLNSLIERADMTSRPENAEFSKAYPLADLQYKTHLASRFFGGNKRILCFGPDAESAAGILHSCGNKVTAADLSVKHAALMIPGAYAMGLYAGMGGETFQLLDDRGREVNSRDIWALKAFACTFLPESAEVFLPGNAGIGLMDYAQGIGAKLADRGDMDIYTSSAGFAAALSSTLTLMHTNISDVLAKLPVAAEHSITLNVQPDRIAIIMRTLSGAKYAQPAGRGIAFDNSVGMAVAYPDITLPGIRITGSAYTAETAEELAGDLLSLAKQAIQEDANAES